MNYTDLPVYRHKDRILEALQGSQVIVVESPTGSGKTTQLPVILNDAGLAQKGTIGVTQPRRIAALSVSEFIARQLGVTIPGVVGYKMRFADLTGAATKIKIMTDGILLQEMKLDPWLSRYDCLLVDEAHERSLTIDFILGLLKRVLEVRADFKVIVSSATINAQVFSEYFGGCPIVRIDAQVYPVTLIYDPPPALSAVGGPAQADALLAKICAIVERLVNERSPGDILIFLSGEKMIKDAMARLYQGPTGRKIHIVPLYGRLGKEEQERVFEKAPWGKTKVVISTNIAETSVTIDGITSVIDSGLSKLNFYSPHTYTSSLVEGPISRASANQRRGRAGRTQEGVCYRLYTRKDFESRPLFTTEEIYRTDLAEVVLQMADLGITAFEEFDFISSPGAEGIAAAIETLRLLGALEQDNTLSAIGKMMIRFPLAPRHSRIIVEAIRNCPSVLQETIIAAAFLSTQNPQVLPPGLEIEARRAHHTFRDPSGDFVSYLKLYRAYAAAKDHAAFCEQFYLDEKAMAEIANVVEQLEDIVSSMQIPLTGGGATEDYLYTVSVGLVQFVCVHEGRELYRSLTADRILIHPGSVMFRTDPDYIVAGEIIRTSRMYASSVSPLSRANVAKLGVLDQLGHRGKSRARNAPPKLVKNFSNSIKIGDEVFEVVTIKGKKTARLPWERLKRVKEEAGAMMYKGLRGVILVGEQERYTLLDGEKLNLILKLLPTLDLDGVLTRQHTKTVSYSSKTDLHGLLAAIPRIMLPALRKQKELGFIVLRTDGQGNYHLNTSRAFHSALNESIASLEFLIDELGEDVDIEQKAVVNEAYRKLSDYMG
ncbi:MAG: ATP-dependent RNA helicase [Spirochaetaceae bacterium]|jgi:RNA helicase HrpA|nr:ATP-dependent RNA helicase [Spirochaetaceae bacterium]